MIQAVRAVGKLHGSGGPPSSWLASIPKSAGYVIFPHGSGVLTDLLPNLAVASPSDIQQIIRNLKGQANVFSELFQSIDQIRVGSCATRAPNVTAEQSNRPVLRR